MPGTSPTRHRTSGSVMTHPKRIEAARRIAADAPPGALSVVVDPDPTGRPSVLRTALAAWSAIEEGATHHLVVQDDMILSDAFFERARLAVEAMPDAALALFALWDSRNGAAVRFGALSGARWVGAVGEYFPCVAIILPREVAAGYVEFARRHLFAWPDDILMDRYLRAAGVPRFVAVPNLAEHDDQGSISGNAFRGPRRSVCFLPEDRPGSEELQLTDLQVIPYAKYGVARCDVRLPGPGRPRWLHIESEQYLEGLGVPVDRLRSRLPRPTPGVDPQTAWSTWLTAYTTGLVHHDLPALREPDPAVLAECLSTLGPGGIAQNGTAEEIAALRDGLADLTRHGLLAAREDGPVRPRPRAVLPSFSLSRADTPLGEHLARGLTDRGHRLADPAASPAALIELPDGTGPLLVHRPGLPTLTLHLGDLYGPGASRHTPLGRMVWSALRSHPILVEGDPEAPRHPLHVNDLSSALSTLLRTPPATTTFTLAPDKPLTTRDLAETVHRVVRPTPVELSPAPAATPTTPLTPALTTALPPGWHPTVDLDYGLHSFAQWLAYEGIHLPDAD
ncbi:NAD-dependent epimerase/dehydratase family protein [Kitasatospora sp. NPDC101183]|uniref:NAD-dependent epimerase/dehydratase family protein n=1 Tax=Kitasatospora sp. NPDC101183 TaxID=3364100 RepID=UPI0038199C25